MVGEQKGYLRIFEEEIEPWRARSLVRRYLKATNGAFSDHKAPPDVSTVMGRVVGADDFKSVCSPTQRGKNARKTLHLSQPAHELEKLKDVNQLEATEAAPCLAWPQPNSAFIERIAAEGNGLVDQWESSPVRLDTNRKRTKEIIDALFPGEPLLCCGWIATASIHVGRAAGTSRMNCSSSVPSPMTARQGITKKGTLSAHSLSNTGPRRFLVVEFDFGGSRTAAEGRLLSQLRAERRDVTDLCASLLLHLAETAPLALAVHSGGKSLHGWFYCAGRTEESRLKRFMRCAVSLARTLRRGRVHSSLGCRTACATKVSAKPFFSLIRAS